MLLCVCANWEKDERKRKPYHKGMQERYENGEKETERNIKKKLGGGMKPGPRIFSFFVLRG